MDSKSSLLIDNSRKQHETKENRSSYSIQEGANPVIFGGEGVDTKRSSEGIQDQQELMAQEGAKNGGQHSGLAHHVTVKKRTVEGSGLKAELRQWNPNKREDGNSISIDAS